MKTFKRSRLLVGALAVCAIAVPAVAAGVSPAIAAQPAGGDRALSAGPVIDPDRQVAEAQSAAVSGTWAGAADPGVKAHKRGAGPKYTGAQLAGLADRDRKMQAAAPSPGVGGAEVFTVEALPGGTGLTIYTPAPGVTAEQLADSLRKQGKKDVRIAGVPSANTGGSTVQLAPSDCAYGAARSLTCPVSYWTNNGFSNPIVRFNDHSGAVWPTTDAVAKWNRVPNIDSWYLWNSCPFMAGARCVDVVSGNYGNTFWVGRSHIILTGAGPIQEQGNYVQLNDYHAPVTFTRNNVVTHELGHILGLNHNTWWGDVLYEFANTREDIGGENPVLLAYLAL